MTWKPTIDDNIPLPPATRGTGAIPGKKFKPRLPLRSMNVGQSMFVPYHACSRKKLDARIIRLAVNHGIRFAVRKVEESGVEGTRLWRVE